MTLKVGLIRPSAFAERGSCVPDFGMRVAKTQRVNGNRLFRIWDCRNYT
jgi:hypothetical protein